MVTRHGHTPLLQLRRHRLHSQWHVLASGDVAVQLQNILLAAGSIAVLALPTVLGCIPLWLAVMFHEGSTLLVALNSLRILNFE